MPSLMTKAVALKTSLFVLVLFLLTSAHAIADSLKPVNVPAGDLTAALQLLEKQSGIQVVYRPELLKGLRTSGVKGTLSLQEALTRLLKGTNLKIHTDRTGVLLITDAGTDASRDSTNKKVPAKEDGGLPPEDPSAQIAHQGANAGDSARSAQHPGGEEPPALQEIIVTAQKYRQAAYSVPVALTVISGDTLQRFGAMSVENLQYQVPGLWVQSNGAQRQIYLGGVANSQGNGSLVSEYIDDADVTASPNLFAFASLDLRMYDLARVEVLRGPQGTLYGEGAEGGAIHYVTNQPALDGYQFGLRGESLFTKDGAPSQRLFPMFNIPIVPNKLGIRIAGEYSNEGGWLDQPAAQRKNINNANLADTRVEALWQPSEQLKLNFLQIIHRKSFGLNYGGDSNENWTAPPFGLLISPHEHDQYDVSNITGQYTMPGTATLVNSATYVRDENSSPDLGAIDPAFSFQLLFYNHYKFSALSDELRLTNEGVSPSSPWRWTVGGLFKRTAVSNYPSGFCFGLNLSAVGNDALLSSSLPERVSACSAVPEAFWVYLGSDIQSKQYSEFADLSYKILDRLTLGAGGRYFKDQQQHFAVGLPLQSVAFTSTDPRAYALYKVDEHVNVYATVAKGFRSGGFNTAGAPPFEPESLWYYDFGIKTHGLGHFDVATDAFYGNYTNFQSFGIANSISITRNGGIVHLKGLDATVQWRPVPGWRVSLDGEYSDARVASLGGFTGTSQLVGERLNYTLRYQLNAAVERDFRVAARPAYLTVGYTQRPGVSFDYAPGVPTYSSNLYILNIAGGIQWNDALNIGFMLQNGLDDRAYVDPTYSEHTAAREQPLTIGVYIDTAF